MILISQIRYQIVESVKRFWYKIKYFVFLGGEVLNYFNSNMCDDDILSCKEYIVLQQDPYNLKDKDKYQTILGNFYLF